MTRKPTKNSSSMFEQLRREMASLLGFNLDNPNAVQSLRLDRAVGLKLELDQLQSQQIAGRPVDIRRLVEVTQQLEQLLPAANETTEYDLSRLNDDELKKVEQLLSKAAGQPSEVGEPTEDTPMPAVEVELLAIAEKRIAKLIAMNADQVQQIKALNARIDGSNAPPISRQAPSRAQRPPPSRNVRSILNDNGEDWDALYQAGLLKGHKLHVYLHTKGIE